jgi:hypothetical protein
MITLLLIVGIAFAVLLADKLGRIRLQIVGFIGCAVGLLLASLSVDISGGLKVPLIFTGFMLFNFMTNLGPNAQTYLLAGEVSRPQSAERAPGLRQPSPRLVQSRLHSYSPSCWSRSAHGGSFTLIIASPLGGAVTWLFRIPHRDHGRQSRPNRRSGRFQGTRLRGFAGLERPPLEHVRKSTNGRKSTATCCYDTVQHLRKL